MRKPSASMSTIEVAQVARPAVKTAAAQPKAAAGTKASAGKKAAEKTSARESRQTTAKAAGVAARSGATAGKTTAAKASTKSSVTKAAAPIATASKATAVKTVAAKSTTGNKPAVKAATAKAPAVKSPAKAGAAAKSVTPVKSPVTKAAAPAPRPTAAKSVSARTTGSKPVSAKTSPVSAGAAKTSAPVKSAPAVKTATPAKAPLQTALRPAAPIKASTPSRIKAVEEPKSLKAAREREARADTAETKKSAVSSRMSPATAARVAAAQGEFEKLSRRYLDWIAKQYPETATYLGLHDNDNKLTSFLPKSVEERREKLREFRKAFADLDERGLDVDSRIERRLIVDSFDVQIALEKNWAAEERDPSLFLDTGVYGCYAITIRECGDAPIAAAKMTERLLAIPKLLAQGKKLITRPTQINCEVALNSGPGAIAFFKDTVAKFAKRVKEGKIRQSMREAAQAAEEAVEEYMAWVKQDLLPIAGPDFAIGRELFNLMLIKQHHLELDVDQLIDLGLKEYQTTVSSLDAICDQINKRARQNFTWEQWVDLVKRDHPTNSELVQYYSDEMKRAKRFVIERALVNIPEGEKIDVVPTPEFARPVIPYAAYMAPAPFEREQRGTFWVTPVDRDMSPEEMEKQLRDHCTHGIVITALHEAYPGHHLQLTVANQLKNRPLRVLLGTSVFDEGWALYCEQMMWEQGFYDDLRARLLQLKDQLWRACRVIIDGKLHTGQMTRDEAVQFLVEKAKLERPNAEAEVLRYCRTPTQPMSYVVGKQQVLAVLSDYKSKRGAAFNLRQFHNEFISHGSLPINMVRQLMGL